MEYKSNKINGPINVIRLIGKIGNIEKILYLFMDIHYPVTEQTECNENFTVDIQNYFAEAFSQLNNQPKKYDFFLEIEPINLEIVTRTGNKRLQYIREILKLFVRNFNFDPKKNKVSVSQTFRNVRFHFVDIRNYFDRHFYHLFSEILHDLIGRFWSDMYINPKTLSIIIDDISDFSNHCVQIKNFLQNVGKKTVKKVQIIQPIINYDNFYAENQYQSDMEYINYIITKIFTKYGHKNVASKLSKLSKQLENYLNNLISQCNKIISKFTKFLNDINKYTDKLYKSTITGKYSYGISGEVTKLMIQEIEEDISKLDSDFIDFFTLFMDIYFLRRFLDKDYITNGIIYGGAYHCNVYIKILVDEFGFKITHTSYRKYQNLDKLHSEINRLSAIDLSSIFEPTIISQCSDIKNFPKNFN